MSDKWLSGSSSESGILRKTKPPHTTTNVDDLLIFGYACKIFRDNEKAKLIDHGKHLIPWMGDSSLKIDRYDVRATLSDISQYEAPPGGYTNRLGYLTAAEQRAEQLCEEERYFSLYNNDVEEEMYQEEELSRLHKMRSSSYGQVAFNYDSNTLTENKEELKEEDEPDEVFVPHPKFFIPKDIELPNSMKLHAIIEKTAKFISSQGAQMEILIKAKQSNNPQFEFLNQNNRLNKYYKHVLTSIKNGLYPIDELKEEKPEAITVKNEQKIENQTHAQNLVKYPMMPVPTLKYKPSADCTYTQLISKIKGVPLPPEEMASSASTQLVENNRLPSNADSVDINYKNLYDYSAYYNTYENNTVAVEPTYTPPPPINQEEPTVPLLPTSKNFLLENEKIKANIKSMAEGVEIKQISTGLMLAQCYNSDTGSEDEDGHNKKTMKFDFPLPPAELQNIIDKTAAYVLKNGKEFEDILRTKDDPRFSFLSLNDEYHRYYIYKVTGIIYPYSTATNGQTNITVEDTTPKPPSPSILPPQPKVITSVSFSIKPKEDQPIPLKPALPQEPSSDEEELKINNTEQNKMLSIIKIPVPEVIEPMPVRSNGNEMPKVDEKIVKPELDLSDASMRDAMLEPSIIEEKREAKRAEDKFKDRMAQVAREKLGLITKEKQLQLERKKKAMAFLNQIKNGTQTDDIVGTTTPKNLINSPSIVTTSASITPATAKISQPILSELKKEEMPIIISPLDTDTESDPSVQSVYSSPTIRHKDKSKDVIKDIDDDDDDVVIEVIETKSRSRSRSKSSTYKRQKRKKSKHHTKKKSKRKASRSPSTSSRSKSKERKHKKRSSSHKSKRRHKDA